MNDKHTRSSKIESRNRRRRSMAGVGVAIAIGIGVAVAQAQPSPRSDTATSAPPTIESVSEAASGVTVTVVVATPVEAATTTTANETSPSHPPAPSTEREGSDEAGSDAAATEAASGGAGSDAPASVAPAVETTVTPSTGETESAAPDVEAPSAAADTTNRSDCASIRGSDYLSLDEREWFLANCIVSVQAGAGETYENPGHVVPADAHVTAIGDSVMLGAASQLAALGIDDIDAAVSRQVSTVVSILASRAQSGQIADEVVLHIGNNGTFTDAQFDQIMAILGSERKVIFVTVKEPRSWQDANNDVITRGVGRYGNTVLADWQAASAGRDDLFYDDSIHLRPAGAQVYAGLIASVL